MWMVGWHLKSWMTGAVASDGSSVAITTVVIMPLGRVGGKGCSGRCLGLALWSYSRNI